MSDFTIEMSYAQTSVEMWVLLKLTNAQRWGGNWSYAWSARLALLGDGLVRAGTAPVH